MKLGEFREKTKRFDDDFELVISGFGNKEHVPISFIGNCGCKSVEKVYIVPEKQKRTFKEFLDYIKELFFDWMDDNLDEELRDEIDFWLCPINPFSRLHISLIEMAGMTVWHKKSWYNANMLVFKVGGKLNLLSKKYQEYYDCISSKD